LYFLRTVAIYRHPNILYSKWALDLAPWVVPRLWKLVVLVTVLCH